MISGDSSGGGASSLGGGEGRGVELARGLRGVAEAAGLGVPELVEGEARILYLALPADELCWKVAGFLGRSDGSEGLFLFGDDVVTVDAKTGGMEVMKAVVFRSWLVDERKVMPVVRWVKDSGEPVKGGLTKDQAELILNSKILRRRLPVITAVHKVRMPWLDGEDGVPFAERKIRLLPRGYDAATGVFTAGTLDFDEAMDLHEAANYLFNLFHTFSWRSENRDFAIHLAALVTMFGRGMYAGKAPMFVYNANIQESGKTTLAWYVSWLVHGSMATKPLLMDQEAKLEQTLYSMALAGTPYTIFDNVDWGNTPVKSALLDEWISNSEYDLRKLGGNVMVQARLRAVTMMTGNNLKLSTDLQRRSLMADLWNPLAGAERVLPDDAVLIDSRFYADERNRAAGLAAVWALVRGWDEAGRPVRPGKELGSFNDWSRTMASVVWFAGKECGGRVWDCLAEGENMEIGDKDSREYRLLAELAVEEYGPGEDGVMRERFEITVAQFAGVARRKAVATFALWPEVDVEGVMSTAERKDGWKYVAATGVPSRAGFLEDEEGTVDEVARMRSAAEWLNPKTRSSFGKALDGKLNDRFFRGPDGVYYHVKKLERQSPARYAITRSKSKA